MIPGAVNCEGLEMQGRNQKAVECCAVEKSLSAP